MPESMKEYWSWFIRLHNRRPASMGLASIPYSEMQAFFNLIGVYPDPYEIELMELFDSIAIKILSEQAEKERKRSSAKSSKK